METDALVLARISGYCTGLLKAEGRLTTEQAMDGLVWSIRSSWGTDVLLPLDLDAARCLKRAADGALRAAEAFNRKVEARRPNDTTKTSREALKAQRLADGMRYDGRTRHYKPAYGVCEKCGKSTANGKAGRPPKFHEECKP